MADTAVRTVVEPRDEATRPLYEKPRIQTMTEQEILDTFQITQAMTTWWAVGGC